MKPFTMVFVSTLILSAFWQSSAMANDQDVETSQLIAQLRSASDQLSAVDIEYTYEYWDVVPVGTLSCPSTIPDHTDHWRVIIDGVQSRDRVAQFHFRGPPSDWHMGLFDKGVCTGYRAWGAESGEPTHVTIDNCDFMGFIHTQFQFLRATPLAFFPSGTLVDAVEAPSAINVGRSDDGLLRIRMPTYTAKTVTEPYDFFFDPVSGEIRRAELHISEEWPHWKPGDPTLWHSYHVTKWTETQLDGRRWPSKVIFVGRFPWEETWSICCYTITDLKFNEDVDTSPFDFGISSGMVVTDNIANRRYIAE